MNLVELCAASSHPSVRKAMERAGWWKYEGGWAFEADTEPHEVEHYHESALALELLRELWEVRSPAWIDAVRFVMLGVDNWRQRLVEAVTATEGE